MVRNYIVSHKEFCEYESDYSSVIWVGPIGGTKPTNDRGLGSIWQKNPSYCELTALHKIWQKRSKLDSQIGFSHYRRQLLLKKISNEERLTGHYTKTSIIPVDKIKEAGFFDLGVEELENLRNFDVVLPYEENIQSSVQDHYLSKHGSESWDLMIRVLEKKGELEAIEGLVDEQNQSARWGNIFILKGSILEELCEWLFSIIEEIEREANRISGFDDLRIFGFLAERMTSVYFKILVPERGLKLLERPTLLIDYENQELWNRINAMGSNEQFWIWGAGAFGEKFLNGLKLMGFERRVSGFIDSKAYKSTESFLSFKVLTKECFFDTKMQLKETFVVVASSGWTQIAEELKLRGLVYSRDFYCLQGLS